MNPNLTALLIILGAASLSLPTRAQVQNVTYTYTYDGPPLPIFRDDADIISIANIFVPKAIRITKVTANIEIDYPRPGDLNIFMYSPILTRTKLLERNCGSRGSVANVTFDDAAPARYADTCPETAGSYRGNEPLAKFNDEIGLGIWSLAAENNGSDDSIGYLRGFTLVISGVAVTTKPITSANAVFNAAGFQSGAVAPGEMINIQGFNLGPPTAVMAPPGNLPTALSEVQVTFDGTPAALSYVSSFVLTVQTPFSIQPEKQTEMRVTYQNRTSDSVMLDVLSAVPGIYTESANGRGLVTAVNPDGSTNSLLHPAPKGQYVTIYAAGLGTLTPPLAAGQAPPPSPVSVTNAPISAVVDGFGANVSFAGAAPGFPGLYQINLQIPTSAGAGARSLALFAGGGASSQFGTIIYVQ